MASGLPVAAADSPATREVLQGGQAGFIFDPDDVESMVGAIREMLFNSARRLAVQEQARDVVLRLDWSEPTKQLLGHYERLLREAAVMQSAPIQDSTT
jgi:glycosyltransferase involved in cell wall biosynthesis